MKPLHAGGAGEGLEVPLNYRNHHPPSQTNQKPTLTRLSAYDM